MAVLLSASFCRAYRLVGHQQGNNDKTSRTAWDENSRGSQKRAATRRNAGPTTSILSLSFLFFLKDRNMYVPQ